ncbi:dTDP-4-dehydrorhamnose reductase [Thiobacillus sp. 65-1402]|uniref:dTDP-4-dehydrorhamnose reductase n=1 Tax=Thiobacillus sp. 65-1402 TaxID=1895861 RepID=UPI0009662FB0|nr:dTDP-4-dehydrorhamnose reductase [Thiobacillus sp. 65-1402]OJW88482.1 MAG: dTDP-4-dehydrorhamnose reductase [Thiobacillus sp. 65-1402]
MRILLTGVNGQVGWELQRTLAPLGEVVAAGRSLLDLADTASIRRTVAAIAPDLIVNPAAYTAVDKAESEPGLAYAVNADAPGELAQAAAARGIPLVHFSTDYVFDGRKPVAYTEADAPNPLGVYGASKLAGEQAVQRSGTPHLILRTSWVYGLRGRNFLLTMQRLAHERDVLTVVDDQFGAPTWSRLIAEACALTIARWLDRPDRAATSGIYHLSCGGRTSWHGFTAAILAQLAATDGKLARLTAIPGCGYPTPAVRPANSQLDCGKLAATFGVRLPAWESALALCLERNLPQSTT